MGRLWPSLHLFSFLVSAGRSSTDRRRWSWLGIVEVEGEKARGDGQGYVEDATQRGRRNEAKFRLLLKRT